MEKVLLVNTGSEAVDVSGWVVSNSREGGTKTISDLKLEVGDRKEVITGPECYLSNKGGTIKLINSGFVVDSVLYTRTEASLEGSWITF